MRPAAERLQRPAHPGADAHHRGGERLSFVVARRIELLEWMLQQPFGTVNASGLLEGVERLVVAEHRALFEGVRGLVWKPPEAYRFIRYESPAPVRALLDATRRLDALWAAERVGAQERVQLYGLAEGHELDRLEEIAAGLGRAS